MFVKGFWIIIKTKYEKPCGQGFFASFFCVIYLVWIQKLKQPMITVKVMTENWSYCGFQGCLQTEKNSGLLRTEHTLLLVILHGK